VLKIAQLTIWYVMPNERLIAPFIMMKVTAMAEPKPTTLEENEADLLTVKQQTGQLLLEMLANLRADKEQQDRAHCTLFKAQND
jgi:hypothetical protein